MTGDSGKKETLRKVKDIAGVGGSQERGGACGRFKVRRRGSLVERFEQRGRQEKERALPVSKGKLSQAEGTACTKAHKSTTDLVQESRKDASVAGAQRGDVVMVGNGWYGHIV